MSFYKTIEQIKHRKWRIDQERTAAGDPPLYAPHEKSEFNPDAKTKRKGVRRVR